MTEETSNSKRNSDTEHLGLCYIDTPWAWFTSLPVEDQWGDDWDNAPYQHNAGCPYPEESVTLEKVAFDGPLFAPDEPPRREIDSPSGHPYTTEVAVEDMNRGENRVPWLVETGYGEMHGVAGVEVYAGVTIPEFVKLVENAGGSVYHSADTDVRRTGAEN
jgi:hypothetical protein